MKITAVLVTLINGAIALLYPGLALPAVLASLALYLVFGVLHSALAGLKLVNDVPNAFRVLLAAAAPFFALAVAQPFGATAALFSFLGALFLNDEYQRRAADSIRKGRVGGTVALLGIDGSGKSTHAAELEAWFKGRGYYCTRVPFHRYLFVDRLGRAGGSGENRGSRRGGNPLRPFLSAVDNILLYAITSFGRGLEGRVVLYDRYIWSTYVKYQALGYPVRPLRWLYMLPRPRYAVLLDITVDKSLGVIMGRPDHIRYSREILSTERKEYIGIAAKTGFPLVDASREPAAVQEEIERLLVRVFPVRGR